MKKQKLLEADEKCPPKGYFLGADGGYHLRGQSTVADGKNPPKASLLISDRKHQTSGFFLGADGRYYPRSSFQELESLAEEDEQDQNSLAS